MGLNKARKDPSETSAAVTIPYGALATPQLRKQPLESKVEKKAAKIPESSNATQNPKVECNVAESALVRGQRQEPGCPTASH